ncbi:unnamed protein product, partial [Rotaria sp. Silwood2]
MSKIQVKLYQLQNKNRNEISTPEHGPLSSSVEPRRDSSLFLVFSL